MFKNLLQFWRGKDFMSHVLDDFKNMLDDTKDMFVLVCRKLVHNEDTPDLENKVYGVDKQVNALEKDIRKRIVEHLVMQPSVDISMSLLLMSVVKDAERVGDYAKDLFDVSKLLLAPIDMETYVSLFNHVEEEIVELFNQTKKAFIESDENNAVKSWEYQKDIGERCERIIEKLSKSALSVNEAVCFTLIARYFKRIVSHLTNIATSVIVPLTDLDYFDEKRGGG